MSARWLRWAWLVTLVSVFALTSPMRGEMQPPAHNAKPDCCAQMQIPASDHDCGDQPAKPAQCCPGCAASLSLIAMAPVRFVFCRNGGKILASGMVRETSRFEQPPVPPPRA